MPALKNKRHEAFAQAHARGMSASDAYRATYGTNSKNVDCLSSRLALSVKIGKRVEEIQKASERVTHLTIEEKRTLYANIAIDRRNELKDRLKAMRDDSELAGHIKAAEAGQISVNVNVVSLSEERRQQLIEKKREAIKWMKESKARQIDTPYVPIGPGTNGNH